MLKRHGTWHFAAIRTLDLLLPRRDKLHSKGLVGELRGNQNQTRKEQEAYKVVKIGNSCRPGDLKGLNVTETSYSVGLTERLLSRDY